MSSRKYQPSSKLLTPTQKPKHLTTLRADCIADCLAPAVCCYFQILNGILGSGGPLWVRLPAHGILDSPTCCVTPNVFREKTCVGGPHCLLLQSFRNYSTLALFTIMPTIIGGRGQRRVGRGRERRLPRLPSSFPPSPLFSASSSAASFLFFFLLFLLLFSSPSAITSFSSQHPFSIISLQ